MTSSSQQSDLYCTAAITPVAETLRLKVLRVIPGAALAVRNNEAPLSHKRRKRVKAFYGTFTNYCSDVFVYFVPKNIVMIHSTNKSVQLPIN